MVSIFSLFVIAYLTLEEKILVWVIRVVKSCINNSSGSCCSMTLDLVRHLTLDDVRRFWIFIHGKKLDQLPALALMAWETLVCLHFRINISLTYAYRYEFQFRPLFFVWFNFEEGRTFQLVVTDKPNSLLGTNWKHILKGKLSNEK